MPEDQAKNSDPGMEYLRLAYGQRMRERLDEGFQGLLEQEFSEIPAEDFMEVCRRVAKRVRLAAFVSVGDFESARREVAEERTAAANKAKLESRSSCSCGGIGYVPFYIFVPKNGRAYKEYTPCRKCNSQQIPEDQRKSEVVILTEKEYRLHQRLDSERILKEVDLPVKLSELRRPDTPTQKDRRDGKYPKGTKKPGAPKPLVAKVARAGRTQTPSTPGQRARAAKKSARSPSGRRRQRK